MESRKLQKQLISKFYTERKCHIVLQHFSKLITSRSNLSADHIAMCSFLNASNKFTITKRKQAFSKRLINSAIKISNVSVVSRDPYHLNKGHLLCRSCHPIVKRV